MSRDAVPVTAWPTVAAGSNVGALDYEEQVVLAGITRWMSIHSGAIYGSRPWKIYGCGPSTKIAPSKEKFNENAKPDLTADDFRFMTVGQDLYAFMMGWKHGTVVIPALGSGTETAPGRIEQVTLVGYGDPLKFTQRADGLEIAMPANPVSDIAVAFRLKLA